MLYCKLITERSYPLTSQSGEEMTHMKKGIRYLVAILGIATGVLAFQGKEVEASAIPASAISIDYDAQRMLIKEGNNPDLQIYYSVPKQKVVKQKNADGTITRKTVLSVSAWESYDYDSKNGVTIDLSNLNRTKDNYIQVKGNKATEPVTIKIPAILNKVAAAYDVATDSVTMSDVTDRRNPQPVQNKTLEYKLANSGWKTYAGDDFSYYQVRGVSLTFRIMADQKKALQASALTTLTDIVDQDDQAIRAYVAGSFPGKEVKVRVAKQASAPKVSVDYARHQFKLPKNAEYRVAVANKLNTWVASDSSGVKVLNLSELSSLVGNNTSVALEVRIKAVGSKPASKACRIDFTMPAAAPEVHTRASGAGKDIVNLDIFDSWIGTNKDDPLLYTGYRYRQTTKAFQGVCIFTTTPEEYEVYISKDGQPPVAASAVTAIKIKRASSTSGNDVETLLPAAKVKNGDRIYVRRKADVKHKVFSSYFAGLGTVDYDPDRHAS